MKNRIDLARYFADLGFTKGVEVGLCTGRYSKILLDNIPNLQLMGIDPYIDYETSSVRRDQTTSNRNLTEARQIFDDYPNFVLVIAKGDDVVQFIGDETLDFVFIDGMHTYEAVKQDIEDWTPKVRIGGIVSGHDYYESKSGKLGVVKAVDEFTQANNYSLQNTGWDKEAFRDDRQPDWWFVKLH